MPDETDWSSATFEGNRRRQHQEFLALPFREKLKRIEQMEEVAARFAKRGTGQAASQPDAKPPDRSLPPGR